MVYFVAVFQTAFAGGKSPKPSTSRRAGVVEAEAPMSDVAVVADPVEELTAAGVVVPAPVLINAHVDVGLHARGADPGLVIEVCRRIA